MRTMESKALRRVSHEASESRTPLPRAAATLGLEVIETSPEDGSIVVGFTADESFTTPRGDVLEGFLAAMLHDTVGPALLATLGPEELVETHDLNATFVEPAFPGRLVGRGRVVRRDGNLALVEAALSDADDRLVALATATLRVVPSERRTGRAVAQAAG
jgi:uncharacterized protein (TIGR00369 family)